MKRDGEEARGVTAGVYFLQAQSSGLIKIGFSGNISERIKSLSTASPEPLRLLGAIAGPIELERALHRGFAQHRVNGEWFRPVESLLALAEISARAWRPPARPKYSWRGPLDAVPETVQDLVLPSSYPCGNEGDLGKVETLEGLHDAAFNPRLNGSSNVCLMCGIAIGCFCLHGLTDHDHGCLLALAALNASRSERKKVFPPDESCPSCEWEAEHALGGAVPADLMVMAYG